MVPPFIYHTLWIREYSWIQRVLVGFGFSIDNIVLMSQLAYRLFTTITASKYTSKELKQLINALFDLHCALDHLEKTANKISPMILSGLNKNDPEHYQKSRRNKHRRWFGALV